MTSQRARRSGAWVAVVLGVLSGAAACGDDAAVGDCGGVSCGAQATCVELPSGPTCACEEGMVMTLAGCVVDPCRDLACEHGQCASTSGGVALCVCDAGYGPTPDGRACAPVGDPCAGQDCDGHGVCAVSAGAPLCVCAAGFVVTADGLGCVEPADLCAGTDCDGHGQCAVSGGAAVCVCDGGYEPTADKLGCVALTPEDPCVPNPCLLPHQTVCAAVGSVAVCTCDDGAQLDATGACVIPPDDPCDPNPCTGAHASQCTADGTVARCSCDPGYALDRQGACTTTLVDPCDPSPCAAPGQGICEALPDGGYACRCEAGYVPDGSGGCEVPDPCDPNPCTDVHRTVCSTDAAGQSVCSCESGFEEDEAGQCVPVDPCDPNPCVAPHRSICSPSINGTVTCSCDSGWSDLSGTCVPADPCAPNPCTAPHRTLCGAVGGEAVCSCDAGYVDNGATCVPELAPECSFVHSLPDAFEPDDCAAQARQVDAALAPDEAHTIDAPGDLDWYAFSCGARDTLAFSVNGLDTYQSFFAANGATVLQASDGQVVRYRCQDAMAPLARVRHYANTATGPYTISFDRIPDDHGDTRATATGLTLGATLPFALEGPGDTDVFSYPCAAGRQYQLLAADADTILTAYDAAGVQLVDTDAQIWRWRASATGTCAVALRLFGGSTGWDPSASVTVLDLGPDDHADALAAATPIASDNTSLGFKLATPGDVDAFSFSCVAGRAYQVTLGEADTVTELFDAAGTRLYDTDAQIVRFRAAASGTCGVRARLFGGTGWDDTASVTVKDLGPDDHADDPTQGTVISADGVPRPLKLDAPADVDAFRFPLAAHRAYRVAVTDADTVMRLTDPSGTVLTDTDGQSYDLLAQVDGVYTLTVRLFGSSGWDDTANLVLTDLGPDTHGWSPATATLVPTTGAEVPGAFEAPGDIDWFTFSADAGHILRLVGGDTDVDFVLYAADGVTTIASRTTNTAYVELPTSGTFVLRITQDYSYRAAYRLMVTDLGVDDVPDTEAAATPLVVDGQAFAGVIEQPGDPDVFVVDLLPAQAYAVEWSGFSPKIFVYAPNGAKLAESSSNPVLFTSSAQGGMHYIWMRHSATSGIGSYTIRVRR